MVTDHSSEDDSAPNPARSDEPAREDDGHSPFPVVAIGASAGGLEAFQQLLANLPSDTGMAFVLVQHLNPRHESRLNEVLARSTSMPVLEAEQDMALQSDHVYLIPPNRYLAIAHGRLQVTPRGDPQRPHLPVDYLFRSLAREQKARAIGVILSGTGSDGTQGVCEIKAVGGITFAQDQKSAAHSGMPLSAMDSGCADFILSPEQIAKRLAEIGNHPYLVAAKAPGGDRPESNTEAQYRKILARMRAVTGVDFGLYRDTTIKRRIMRRMAVHTQQSLEDYTARLERDDSEVRALYDDLLINVTSFFREPDVFEALKKLVYPQIVKDKPPVAPIRVWVPGCSTGQEAYSIALSLMEFFDNQPVRSPVQIFATDLSDVTSLEKARAGIYPESIEAEVSPERLRRFFVKEDHIYRITKPIRDLCVFARQNVAADPPFSHVDLISCRNLLIYLAPALQKRVLPSFHYALNSPGFLVLGSAESVGDNADLFELLDRTNKIYSKKPTASRPPLEFAADDVRRSLTPGLRREFSQSGAPADFQREADRILLGRYAPAGVLVNENLDIIQFRGRTSAYLESPPGEPTTSLLKMAREGLFLELRNVCAEASRERRPVRRDKVRVRSDGGFREISLEVVPVRPPGVTDACLLVIFHESEGSDIGKFQSHAPIVEERGTGEQNDAELEISQLQKELTATKDYLQTMIEQQDAANEELRSANEEILSSNEELQSTNEELETAKEELQSTNEELTTVNEQVQFRNMELNQLTNDLTNLLTSSAIPVVMVGPDLRVRRFTAAARKSMNLLSSDIGRPIGDLKPPVDMPDLEGLIGDVIDQVQVRERQVRDRDGRWNLLRIHPYRTVDNKIDGAVILLLDIDDIKRVEEDLSESRDYVHAIIETVREPLVVLDGELRVKSASDAFYRVFATNPKETEGQLLYELGKSQWNIPALRAALEEILPQNRALEEFEMEHEFPVIGRKVMRLNARGIYRAGRPTLILLGIEDITERKRLADEVELHVAELKEADRRKDEFLATLAHELRNPLAPLINATQILRSPNVSAAQSDWCREVIERQVKQMARLLDDLLDVSRITRNVLQFRMAPAELGKIIVDAVEESGPLIEAAGQELSVELPDGVVYLDADAARLTQVFSNLLNNAAKYTQRRGEIQLIARPDGDSITVSVKDSGSGIAPELLPRVFDLFFQGDAPGTSAQGGLGLGLTLAKHFVEMHGGTIEARSEGSGKGSEFIVRLPGRRDEQPRAAVTPAHSDEGEAQASRRILIVDDRDSQSKSLGMLLEAMGHQVRLARDGPSALTAALDFNPEVALVDIGLPGMSGYEVARRLRELAQFKNLMLIAQTGWSREEDREHSREAGFDHHLAKPLDHQALFRLISGRRED
jgi:two-component system CheB/CheR fusion protein